jgi:hypothetical protein
MKRMYYTTLGGQLRFSPYYFPEWAHGQLDYYSATHTIKYDGNKLFTVTNRAGVVVEDCKVKVSDTPECTFEQLKTKYILGLQLLYEC